MHNSHSASGLLPLGLGGTGWKSTSHFFPEDGIGVGIAEHRNSVGEFWCVCFVCPNLT